MSVFNFDLSTVFTSDLIVNGSDTSQTAIDANYSLMTKSFAVAKGGTSSQGLPDNGVFAANSYHPAFDLLYDNANNGNNGILATAAGVVTTFYTGFQVYSQLHFFATSAGGASNITVKFNYLDGTSSSTSGTIPDWYSTGGITESQNQYYLANTLNLSTPTASALGTAGGITNTVKLFGVMFAPDSTKTLTSVSIDKTSTTGKLAFFGAAGVTTDDFAADITTTGKLPANGAGTSGIIEASGDKDWFKVDLMAHIPYTINAEGVDTGKGNIVNITIGGIYNSAGVLIANTTDDDSGVGYNAQVNFTPTTSGSYYVEVQGNNSLISGSYTVSATLPYGTFLNGTAGADTWTGPSPSFSLFGDRYDVFNGLGGNDILTGGESTMWGVVTNLLDGGLGDDLLTGGHGANNTMIGGDGNDTLTGGESSISGCVTNILDGGLGDDLLTGGYGANNILNGGDGNDLLKVQVSSFFGDNYSYTIHGGAGIDTVNFNAINKGVVVILNGATITTFSAPAENPTLLPLTGSMVNVENAVMSGQSDTVTVIGGSGNHVIDGGLGNDSLFLTQQSGDSSILVTDTSVTTSGSINETTSFSNIEQIVITGGNGNNLIDASAFTQAGLTLIGSAGNDILKGGSGNNTADYSYLNNATLTINGGTVTAGTGDVDTLSNIEAIKATAGNDVFNVLAGDYLLDGDTGNDTVNFGHNLADYTFSISNGQTLIQSVYGSNPLSNIESPTFADHGVSLQNIDSSTQRLTGSAMGETINGGAGSQIFVGLAGDDTFNGGADFDTTDYSSATSNLVFNGVTKTITGGADVGTDTLLNIEQVIAGTGNNTADYSATVEGINVDLVLDLAQSNSLDGVDETGTDTLVNFQNATGGSGADILVGDTQANLLVGNAGNDDLSSGDGNDTLNGGTGIDLLQGGNGNDTYYVDNAGDIETVKVFKTSGILEKKNTEKLEKC